jgi:hypothetical protein
MIGTISSSQSLFITSVLYRQDLYKVSTFLSGYTQQQQDIKTQELVVTLK